MQEKEHSRKKHLQTRFTRNFTAGENESHSLSWSKTDQAGIRFQLAEDSLPQTLGRMSAYKPGKQR